MDKSSIINDRWKLMTESLLSSLLHNSLDAIIVINLEGTILMWNTGAQRIFGYKAQEVQGRNINIIRPVDKRDSLVEETQQLLRTGQSFIVETERITKYGQRIYVSLSCSPVFNPEGQIIALAGIERDKTEQITSERQLVRMEDILRSTLKASPDAIILIDSEGKVMLWNRGAEDMLGWAESEMLGETLERIIPEQHQEAHRNGVHHAARSNQLKNLDRRYPISARHRDGHEFEAEVNLTAVVSEYGTVFCGVIRKKGTDDV